MVVMCETVVDSILPSVSQVAIVVPAGVKDWIQPPV